ncbi:hypothetical protein COO60DRAFT_45476 [Scenedesmus sp. NREL 46B-D3]|nr:hypothetical protein COO60DRAFT_45476 [Scenedesmus sp. NREL 46B-D3]
MLLRWTAGDRPGAFPGHTAAAAGPQRHAAAHPHDLQGQGPVCAPPHTVAGVVGQGEPRPRDPNVRRRRPGGLPEVRGLCRHCVWPARFAQIGCMLLLLILMYADVDLEAYLSAYDPTVLSVYGGLKTAVERSDLWRYVVMCRHGGVYTDADTLCVRPIQEWNRENHNDAEAMFGVEDVFRRDPGSGSSGWGASRGRFGIQFEQWTLAGAPHHPVYCNMHAFISQRIQEEAGKLSPAPPGSSGERENWSILHRTGPHVWTDSVLDWMHGQGIGFHEALVPGGLGAWWCPCLWLCPRLASHEVLRSGRSS